MLIKMDHRTRVYNAWPFSLNNKFKLIEIRYNVLFCIIYDVKVFNFRDVRKRWTWNANDWKCDAIRSNGRLPIKAKPVFKWIAGRRSWRRNCSRIARLIIARRNGIVLLRRRWHCYTFDRLYQTCINLNLLVYSLNHKFVHTLLWQRMKTWNWSRRFYLTPSFSIRLMNEVGEGIEDSLNNGTIVVPLICPSGKHSLLLHLRFEENNGDFFVKDIRINCQVSCLV